MTFWNKNLESRVQRLERELDAKRTQVDLLEDVFPLDNETELQQWEEALNKYRTLREQFVNSFLSSYKT